jgi:hypothetical protein
MFHKDADGPGKHVQSIVIPRIPVAHNLTPGIIKEVHDSSSNFPLWEARDKPIWIEPVTLAPVNVDVPESLAPRSEKREATEKE